MTQRLLVTGAAGFVVINDLRPREERDSMGGK